MVKAKQAISSYRKATSEPAGLAELMVFYCERAAGFSAAFGSPGESCLEALVRMFAQALNVIRQLPEPDHDALIARLNRAREDAHKVGYGVGDFMDSLLAEEAEPDV